jgi:hypothetical protein
VFLLGDAPYLKAFSAQQLQTPAAVVRRGIVDGVNTTKWAGRARPVPL